MTDIQIVAFIMTPLMALTVGCGVAYWASARELIVLVLYADVALPLVVLAMGYEALHLNERETRSGSIER